MLKFVENETVRDAAMFFGGGTGRSAFLNDTPGLQHQHVGGRIPHGAHLREPIADKSVPREVALSRKAMDCMALDYQVFFPSALLFLGMHPQREIEAELATAYNRWIVEHVLPHEPRMKAMLYLPFNTPEAAEATVKRFLGAPGVVGFLVTRTRYQPVHANEYMRLYAMLEEAGMPIGFHAHHNWNNEYTRHLNRFLSMHAISFVLSNMIHLTNWVINGLPVRFPKLKVMWIESGLAWLPFLMQRLDHEYLMRVSEAPLLRAPAERVHRRDVLHDAADGGDEPQAARGHVRGDPRRHPAALRLGLAALGLRRAGQGVRPAVPRRARQAQHPRAQRGARVQPAGPGALPAERASRPNR